MRFFKVIAPCSNRTGEIGAEVGDNICGDIILEFARGIGNGLRLSRQEFRPSEVQQVIVSVVQLPERMKPGEADTVQTHARAFPLADVLASRLPVGTHVVIDSPKQPRWHEEEGVIVAANPPGTSGKSTMYYVVHVAGFQPLLEPHKLKLLSPTTASDGHREEGDSKGASRIGTQEARKRSG
ncbi:MAG: hypothetical protein ACYDCC_04680 [Actinomycetota bacterium]